MIKSSDKLSKNNKYITKKKKKKKKNENAIELKIIFFQHV